MIVRLLVKGQFLSLGPLLRLRCVTNSRGSAGIIRNRLAWLLLWGLTALSLMILVQYGPFFGNHVARVGLGAALGGATSNVLDRLSRGAVIDFIDIGFRRVFNLADIAIVSGVTIAFWFMR
ncbi:MAG: signal peptidase II [candidate division NC10 bacterium]|nr:signal peptidase II [candidate division NC10 bacterium]